MEPLDPEPVVAPVDPVAARVDPGTPELDDAEFFRWYGRWASLTPPEVGAILEGLDEPWWIIGGWAIDAATGIEREHDDIDVGFFRAALPALLEHLAPDYCVWSNLSGTLRPLREPGELLEGARQLWVRRDGDGPWLLDLAMTAHDGDAWISPRDERVRRPLADATFVRDGIRYLRPEIVLFMKARWARAKDDRDLDVTLSVLDPATRDWLREAIDLVHPGHRWLERVVG